MNEQSNELPAVREAIIEQAHRVHQEVAHERDTLRLQVADLKTEIAGLKAMLEVAEVNVTQLESHVKTADLARNQAVADRAVYETLFISIQAQFRAFAIPAAPLVREKEATDGYEDNLSRESNGPDYDAR